MKKKKQNKEQSKKINLVCDRRLDKYFSITEKALNIAKKAEKDNNKTKEALDILDMAQRYFDDAKYYRKQGNYVTAFASVNYAHGLLDAGARTGLFKVSDNKIFAVD